MEKNQLDYSNYAKETFGVDKLYNDELIFKQPNPITILCEKLGYEFKSPQLLSCALIIPLAEKNAEVIQNYTALATLGDGFLRAIIEDILLEIQANLSKGHLSLTRDKLVNNKYQAIIAKKLNLSDFLITNDNKRLNKITDKILADCLEAIIGAVFLDSNRNYLITKKLVIKLWRLEDIYNELLVRAATQKDINKINYLLSCGADPNLKLQKFLFSNQDIAYFEIPKEFSSCYSAESNIVTNLLCEIATQDKPEIAELLLKHGADVNSVNILHHSPLYNAAYAGHFNIVKLLCNYKAKILNSLDGYTPLHIAVLQNHGEIVELLINETDIDINHVTPYGKTPLYVATVKENYLIAEKLLSHGALINMACVDRKNQKFTTVLHAAIENSNLDFLKLFVTNNARLDVVNDKKQTPLHLAVLKSNVMAIKIIVGHGANLFAKDIEGKIPSELTDDANIKSLLQHELITNPITYKNSPNFFKDCSNNQPCENIQTNQKSNKLTAQSSMFKYHCAIL